MMRNRQFKSEGLSYTGTTGRTSLSETTGSGSLQGRTGLRALEQESFEEILTWSNAKWEKIFTAKGILARTSNKYACWHCKSPMKLMRPFKLVRRKKVPGKPFHRCTKNSCSGKQPRLMHARHQWTPLVNFLQAGQEPNYKLLGRCAAAFGVKMPQDVAWHVVRGKDDVPRTAQNQTDSMYKAIRFATAFAEHAETKEDAFQDEIVDADWAKLSVERRTKRSVDVPPAPEYLTRTKAKAKAVKKATAKAKAKSASKKSKSHCFDH